MQDLSMFFAERAVKGEALKNVPEHDFIVATLHRAENTDDPIHLKAIVDALNYIHQGLKLEMIVLEPVGYLEMLWLVKHCSAVVSDSGGVQNEVFL